jgi:hypothetical protein
LLATRVAAAGLPDVLPTGGINLGGYNYYDQGVPFIDLAKMGHEWLSTDGQIWSDDRPLTFTTSGYPAQLAENQIARSVVFTHNGRKYDLGNYQLTWAGTGTVRLTSSGRTVIPLSTETNRAEYDVNATSDIGLLVEIWETDPSDPVRDIRLVQKEYSGQSSPFHPLYTRDLQNYGVVRFLDWVPTNGNGISEWAARSNLTDAFWGNRRGIPYEMQIALGNETQQDIWLTIPHAASNDYITQLARMVDEQLDPNLRVWVEYTNEAWNASFAQNDYVQNVLRNRYSTSVMSEAYALRAGEVFDVFSQEVAPERMIRVMGGWAQTPFVLTRALPAVTNQQGETNADVAAIAAYFGLNSTQMDALYADFKNGQVDLDRVFSEMRADIDESAISWKTNREIAESYGLPLVSYEGGQHLVPFDSGQRNDDSFNELLFEIQRDPRMGELYEHLFEKWREIGGSTLTLFTNMDPWGRGGAWGLKEGFDDPVAPKFDAVQAYLSGNPGGWDLRTRTWLGDINGNGSLDVADIDQLTLAISRGQTTAALDLNRDGGVDLDDHTFWVETIMVHAAGDANLDGIINSADLVQALSFGTYEDQTVANATWESGDWNGDREFDSGDLIAMFKSGRYTAADAAVPSVPEPSGVLLLLICTGLLWAGARRKYRGGSVIL